jgi:hypothetical protein
VSADYYTRLEQGRPITPSTGIMEAIARALNLDEAGRAYLRHLSQAHDLLASWTLTGSQTRPN